MSTPMANSPVRIDLAQLAEEAAIWGCPLVLAGRYLDYAEAKGFPFNEFHVNPFLADPDLDVVGPNIDTLYGLAWLDLSESPQIIEVPDTDDRYYSIQILDAWLMTFMYVGRRETGTKAGRYAVTGPGFNGALPDGVTQISCPTSIALAVVRTLVRGDDDLAEAQAVHSAFTLGALADWPGGRKPAVIEDNALALLPGLDLSGAGDGYFDELCGLLLRFPPNAADAAHLARFAPIGLIPGATPSRDADLAPILAAAVPSAIRRILATNFFYASAGAWTVNAEVDSYAFDDPLMRASINIHGPAWHLSREALYYPNTRDAEGRPLSGERRYTLTFPADAMPPVDCFWSLGMYGPKFSLVRNPIKRYSFNSFSNDLKRGADGSLRILIQHDEPEEGTANWLPAPSGEFMLFIRAYQPKPELISGAYQFPPVHAA